MSDDLGANYSMTGGLSKIRALTVGLLAVAAGVAVSLCCLAADPPAPSPATGFDPLTAEQIDTLTQAFQLIKHDYAGRVDDNALMYGAIKGMVSSLDPHSAFLEPAAYARLREQLNGGFAGVGLQVGQQDGALRVFAPVPNSPAAKAGIRAGDLVTRIDETPAQGLTLADAVKRMRGEPGTQVRLVVYRPAEDRSMTFVLTRAFIHQNNVTMERPVPGFGYVRIGGFNEETVPDLANRLKALAQTDPELKGLVLDLRANGGGVLQDAVGVASAFLPQNTEIVSVQDRQPKNSHVYRSAYADYRRPAYTADPLADLPAIFKTVPMVVLTNAQSVSVTEVLAAALQDTHRAVVMGSATFGKGTIQATGPLPGGAGLMLTVARYYTPSGRSLQNVGVQPDLPVDDHPPDQSDDLPAVREIDLDHHLSSQAGRPDTTLEQTHAAAVITRLQSIEAQRAQSSRLGPTARRSNQPAEYGKPGDFMLSQALNWLQHKPLTLSKAKQE